MVLRPPACFGGGFSFAGSSEFFSRLLAVLSTFEPCRLRDVDGGGDGLGRPLRVVDMLDRVFLGIIDGGCEWDKETMWNAEGGMPREFFGTLALKGIT